MASPENRHRAASVVSAHYIIACLTSSREVGLTDCSRGTPAHGLSESSRYRRRLPPGGLCLRARVCVWAFVGSRAPSAKLQQLRHCVCVGGCDRQTDGQAVNVTPAATRADTAHCSQSQLSLRHSPPSGGSTPAPEGGGHRPQTVASPPNRPTKSNLTAWCNQISSNSALNALK